MSSGRPRRSSSQGEQDGEHGRGHSRSSTKRLRTRTGCWNCRRKRKKCGHPSTPEQRSSSTCMSSQQMLTTRGIGIGDEKRPACGNCARKDAVCEWGVRLTFRPENIETIPADHPSLQHHGGNESRSARFIEVREHDAFYLIALRAICSVSILTRTSDHRYNR